MRYARGFCFSDDLEEETGFVWTADTPISTPIPTATNFWYRSETGQPKTEKTDKKPTTSKMDGNLSQKRNNGNGTFSWKYYKDNVTEQHRK